MSTPRNRILFRAVAALIAIWGLAIGGYLISGNLRVTGEKIRADMAGIDLGKLSAADRAAALARLADQINRLSFEERQQLRLGRAMETWFQAMTEDEKGAFIEATMPTGFKQMIVAFEQQPEERRRRSIDEALRRLRETSEQTPDAFRSPESGTNRPPPLSPELEAKVRTIGLKSFYSQSSAQTKAELAPVLEELQRLMESGRGPRR
jgi:hypothetical protein